MKEKCIAGGILILLLCAFFALSISAQTPIQISAADWWNSQTSTCKLFCYNSSGIILNTAVPVNPASFISKTFDLKPYVPWTSVTSGYISSRFAYLQTTFTPLPNSASMYMLMLEFSDEWILMGGRTYEFIILRDYIAFYDSSGVATSTGTQLKSVSLGGLNMTLEDYYIGKDGYDRAIRCTVTPETNTKVQHIDCIFKSNYNPTLPASKIVVRLGFSSVVAYTGTLQDVTVNPTLNNLDKQVGEINDKIDEYYNGDYGKLTGSHPDNPADALPESGAVNNGNSALDRMEQFLNGVPSNVPQFWKNVMEFLFAIPMLTPFVVMGVGFILSRMLMGR